MASSSSNQYATVEIKEEEYPYPSNLSAASFISVKLSGRDKYAIWKTQMVCLLKSHDMFGFIDGTLKSPQTDVSGKEKVDDHHTHRLWTRSDALVKGWILGSLTEETLMYVLNRLTNKLMQHTNVNFTAKDVWDELQIIYGPPPLQTTFGPVGLPQRFEAPSDVAIASLRPHLFRLAASDLLSFLSLSSLHLPISLKLAPSATARALSRYLSPDSPSADKQEEKRRAGIHQLFYQALVGVRAYVIDLILSNGEVTVIDKITNNGNTALHVAVGATKKADLLQKLLEKTPENTQLLDLRNSDGSTLLHVAAIVGNTQAADILVGRNPDLLFAKDNEGHTPLAIALSNMHTETAQHLLQHIGNDLEMGTLFSGSGGDELLVTAISSKDFRLACDLLGRYKTLHGDAVLMAIFLNFPRELNMLEEFSRTGILHSKIESAVVIASDYTVEKCGWPYIKERVRTHLDAILLLASVCDLIRFRNDPMCYHQYYMNPLYEAIRQNSYDVVEYILSYFPDALTSANEEGHNIIQYAVINRSENIYNMLYQMGEHKNIYRTVKDPSRNNLLHLAARLAPSNKLNLISGAALQIQRELQWFKEVERFVCPLNIIQRNSFDETPQMVFTREHKDLVVEGEKWMKATAESYTITAALIVTVVFAAAIRVPGGNNQDTGLPVFTNNTAFTIFAISDAISLFAAVTSLLTFLSVLTARFAEQDFLFKLPTKLIIGLATLFISTTSMIVAFGATLYIVFGQRNSRILIPIVVLTCLPIISFVTLQFRLIIDLMRATYGRSIFGKKRDDTF
ncbi:uncharacterized protein LOC111877530 [Lactuca sativa]|uniref:uncharacterized protein LOC111877530 n=1 Tax=Lactuca sativa TaxID=4236 RepID=UPI000CD96001|nr:uncharacterized protein LOC111877530 [Lactuca sativa]